MLVNDTEKRSSGSINNVRRADYSDLEEFLVLWMKKNWERNYFYMGFVRFLKLISKKLIEFAEQLKITGFKPITEYLEKIKIRIKVIYENAENMVVLMIVRSINGSPSI